MNIEHRAAAHKGLQGHTACAINSMDGFLLIHDAFINEIVITDQYDYMS